MTIRCLPSLVGSATALVLLAGIPAGAAEQSSRPAAQTPAAPARSAAAPTPQAAEPVDQLDQGSAPPAGAAVVRTGVYRTSCTSIHIVIAWGADLYIGIWNEGSETIPAGTNLSWQMDEWKDIKGVVALTEPLAPHQRLEVMLPKPVPTAYRPCTVRLVK